MRPDHPSSVTDDGAGRQPDDSAGQQPDDSADRQPDDGAGRQPDDAPTPLPGEIGRPNVAARRRAPISKKSVFAIAVLVASLAAVSIAGIQRLLASGRKTSVEDSQLARDKPTAASGEPHRLEMPTAASAAAASTASGRVPALTPGEDELSEPIGVRRTGSGAPAPRPTPAITPADAPVLLVSSRASPGVPPGPAPTRPEESEHPVEPGDPLAATSRNLQAYQRQLQAVLENLTRTATLATGSASASPPAPPLLGPPAAASPGGAAAAGLFGGQLQGASTARAVAGQLGNRSLTLAKGTAFTCALKTRVISATSGLVGCQVQRNVFSDDGRVLLIERGSHLDGEYRITSVRPGMVRIPVLWTRIRTPLGVTVDIESPGTGKLGESGIDGHVDNRWADRIGAAMLLSLIDDSVKLAVQNPGGDRQGDTVVLPSTTSNTSKLAEKVLDSTINIPPLIYQNQGGIVGIYVARDVDFSSVYALVPTDERPQRP